MSAWWKKILWMHSETFQDLVLWLKMYVMRVEVCCDLFIACVLILNEIQKLKMRDTVWVIFNREVIACISDQSQSTIAAKRKIIW